MSNGRRAFLALAALAAVAASVFLLVGNPFAPSGNAHLVGDGADDAPAPVGLDEGTAVPAVTGEPPALAGGFEVAGTGEVTVRLLTYKGRTPMAGQLGRLVPPSGAAIEKTTGEDGRLHLRGVPTGRDWTFAVAAEGLAPIELKGVAVRAGRLTDLGDLLLGERVVLHGRVVDTRGRPVAGAIVSAYTGGGLDWSQGIALAMVMSAVTIPEPADRTRTDERGAFTLEQLVPGVQYDLATKHAGLAFAVQSGLVVAPERASAVLTIVLGPGVAMRGKVLDEKGRPISDATVVALEDTGGAGMRNNAGATLKKDFARTKADGSYVIDTLALGSSYRFGVMAAAMAPVFDSSPTRMDHDLERDFQLAVGGAIEGTVTDSQSGQPLAQARVVAIVGSIGMGPMGGRGGRRGQATADGASAAPEQASTQTTTTDATGRFRLDGLRPGPVAIAQVKASGYADFAASQFTNNGWGEVVAGATLTATVAMDPGGSVTGKVLAQTATGLVPLPGAQVAVLSMQSMWTGFPVATTGEDGSYQIDGVRAGSQFTVTATAQGYVAPAMNPFDGASQVRMPDEGGVVTKDLTLTAAGAVEGLVTNAKGLAVPGARVRVRVVPQRGRGFSGAMMRQFLPGGAVGTVLSDGEGRYRIDSVTSEESCVVEADTDEYVLAESAPFQVRAGETQRVDIVLQGGASLRGRVVDERGALVGGATLRVGTLPTGEEEDPNLSGWRADRLLDARVFVTDPEGLFEITKIQPGRILLKADKDGYVTNYRRDLRLTPDEVRENHTITLTKGETISGLVKGDDGRPVVGAAVAVTRQENPVRGPGGGAAQPAPATESDGTVEATMSARTDAQGRFVVENVPPGKTYSVVVWFAPGYRGYGQGDDAAIRRAVDAGAKDVELLVKKLPEGEDGFGGGRPRDLPRPVAPVPSGAGRAPAPPAPPPAVPGMGG